MEKKYNKSLYYAHDFNGNAILAEQFNTLKDFKDYAKANDFMVCFCPLNHASTMVSNYKLIKP